MSTAVKDSGMSKEVRKMTAFILQEAVEKAHELHIRADEEYAVEKARLLRAETAQLDSLLAKKVREGETRRRIAESAQSNRERLKVLSERDSQLRNVFEETESQLANIYKDNAKYSQLLIGLVHEAIAKLSREKELVVECRRADAQLVSDLISTIKAPTLTLQQCLPEDCPGGVVLKNKSNAIRCDNTLTVRLKLAIEELLSEIRTEIFGASKSRKFKD